ARPGRQPEPPHRLTPLLAATTNGPAAMVQRGACAGPDELVRKRRAWRDACLGRLRCGRYRAQPGEPARKPRPTERPRRAANGIGSVPERRKAERRLLGPRRGGRPRRLRRKLQLAAVFETTIPATGNVGHREAHEA